MWPNVEFRTQVPKKNLGLVRSSLQWTTCGWATKKGPQTLAKEARWSGISQVWKGVVPSVVENLICDERGL